MRVGVDASPLVQTRAGTARHVRGLLGALRDRPGLDLELLTFGGPGRGSSVVRDALWYPVGLPRRARDLDLLHCTTFRGPAKPRVPTVLTVHDLAILRSPEAFPRWHRLYGHAGLRRVLRAADAVVAVSEFTRDEVVALADVPAERIRVVPNGVDPIFSPDQRGVSGPSDTLSQGDYVLAVATLEPRKNLGRVVEAAQRAGAELRVVGARGWGGVEVAGWVGEVPDAELVALYRGARCVLYPSLYEGFGLPVLEGMACGAPVVTSRGDRDGGDCGRRGRARRPARCRIDRGRHRRGGSAARRARHPRPRPRVAVHVERRRRRGRSALAGARMTSLVVLDADVLGRERTGDETYVRNLLRELALLAPEAGIRLAAVTRRPDLVPGGVEPVELSARSQELRMARSLPRALRRLGAALCHTQYALPVRAPCPCVVTVHDVSFARDPGSWVVGTGSCSVASSLGRCAGRRVFSRSRSARSAISSSSTACRLRRWS